MHYFTKSITAVIICLLVGSITNAQDEASLKRFVEGFYEGYLSDESRSLNSPNFRNYFDEGFVGSDVDVDLQGNVEYSQLDFEKMKKEYERYRMADGIGIDFEVTDFHNAVVKGNTGIVSMQLDFTINKNGSMISKGTYDVSLTAKSYEEEWKITFINSVFIESEVFMGKCICEIFKKDDTKYATFLTVPDGDTYTSRTDRFEVSPDADQRVVTLNSDQKFSWNTKSNKVYAPGDEVIGSSVIQPSTAILNVLRFANKDKCQSIETKD